MLALPSGMLPKRSIPIFGFLAVFALVSGCGARTPISEEAGQSSTSSTGNSLSLEGPKNSVFPGDEAYVRASGGVPPYSYYIISGKGSIDSASGLFKADLEQGNVMLGVQDSAGKTAWLTLAVGQGWGSSVVLTPASGNITVTQQVALKATGGSSPYYYSIVSGGGTLVDNIYTAPSTTGSVTLVAVDSTGGTATVTYNIQAIQTLSLSPATKTMVAGTQATFSVTGGVPPYAYSVVYGGGAFVAGKYTAGLIVGPARIQVKDAQGAIALADITITPNYSTTHQSANFQLIADHYLAFAFDNSIGDEHPNFTFWGNGPNVDAAGPGKNCPAYTQACARVVTLNNFSNLNFAYATYRGTIGMGGRSGSAHLSFCIDPADTTRAKIRWEDGAGFTSTLSFGGLLFHGSTTTAAYSTVDSGSGAGYVTVNFDGAYTNDIDCSDFTGSYEVRVTPR